MNTFLYNNYFHSIADEMKCVEHLLFKELQSESETLFKASTHLIGGGGKRLRPAFLLLVGKLFQDNINYLLPMSCSMELAHMGTLVHDDVVDVSDLRRGLPTVRVCYGEKISLYAGSYLMSQSLRIANEYNQPKVVQKILEASCEICSGEIMQLNEAFLPTQNMKNYLRRIRKKTALLISLSCEVGAILSGATEEEAELLKKYGCHLGMAFQISDDVLDFSSKEAVLGKPVGSDIRNGIITLPLIYAMEKSKYADQLNIIIKNKCYSDDNTIREIVNMVRNSGALEYSMHSAEKYAQHAIYCLKDFKDCDAKKDLINIARQISRRKF